MRHKAKVYRLCKMAGFPIRGLLHDMSKFSPTEFIESVKYYNGKRSPILGCIKENGYSKAWLHHKGRNKHHYEYWYDEALPDKMPIIPYKYVVEMICDNLAAGMTYKGDEWTKEHQIEYWLQRREKTIINPTIDKILVEVFSKVAIDGVEEVVNKDVLRSIYDKHVTAK